MNTIQKKKIITDTLIKAGADISYKGFHILRDVVLAYMEYDIPASAVQDDMLSAVGEKYGMNSKAVYRDIRFMVDNISRYKDVEFLENYFGTGYRQDRGKVLPKTFIIRIADDVSIQCEELLEETK